MKKKIFHFVSTNVLSGLENIVINISTLVKGYDYTYVSPDGPINDYLDSLGIKHISIKRMTPFNAKKIIKNYNPDIVQGHDVKASISLAFNYFICKRKNIKIISELHNDDPRMHKLSLRSCLYKLSSKYYDQIIVVSKSVINNYIFRKDIEYKTTIIDNVINPLRIKNNIKNSNNKWDLIFIGRLVKQKDPLSFVKIIYGLKKKYNKNITAIIVGDGPLKQSIFDLIRECSLSSNIQLVGFQSNPYQYINDSRILLMPSKFEGIPLVSLEALMIGTPIIASPVGGLKEIIDDDCGCLAINNYNFINKTYELLNNKRIYTYKSNHGIIKSKKINNTNKFIKLYDSVYDN